MDITFSNAQVLNELVGHPNLNQLSYTAQEYWIAEDSLVLTCASFSIMVIHNNTNGIANVINLRPSADAIRETIITKPKTLNTTSLKNFLNPPPITNQQKNHLILQCDVIFDKVNISRKLNGSIEIY